MGGLIPSLTFVSLPFSHPFPQSLFLCFPPLLSQSSSLPLAPFSVFLPLSVSPICLSLPTPLYFLTSLSLFLFCPLSVSPPPPVRQQCQTNMAPMVVPFALTFNCSAYLQYHCHAMVVNWGNVCTWSPTCPPSSITPAVGARGYCSPTPACSRTFGRAVKATVAAATAPSTCLQTISLCLGRIKPSFSLFRFFLKPRGPLSLLRNLPSLYMDPTYEFKYP